MHRRIWFLGVAAVAVLAVAGSASAMRTGPASAKAGANGFTMPNVGSFAQSWAQTPRTPAARAHASTINVAMEQDIGSGNTWNINQANSTLAWAVWVGWNPILRSPYLVTYTHGHYVYKYDLVTKVKVNHKYIRYYIRKNANWNWGGKTMPVTWRDFALTVEWLNNPKSQVSSNVGVNQIAKVKHTGNKIVTFYWKKKGQYPLGGAGKGAPKGSNLCSSTWPCGPFADYKDLIGSVYPYAAVHKLNFNTMWAKCICGSNGKPVSNGPYLMTNYTRGQGVTLKANNKWYGHKASIKKINFKIITDVNSEIQAIRGGEVDAASPQPVPAIAQLRSDKKVIYKVAPGNYLEHIDIQLGSSGPQTSPGLLKAAWFRHVLMMGINRSGIIKAALPGVAPGLKPLNSLLVFQSDARYKNYFKKWNYNPKKAISTLRSHGCKGGPSKPTNGNSNYYSCGGHQAAMQFMYANDNPRRVASEQIIQANLGAIGIKVIPNGVPTSTLFGANGAPAGNYDLTEFAWGGAVDPGGFIAIWGCGGGENWLHYCNHKVTSKLDATETQLNVKKRNADFIKADKLMSNDVPAIPLYALPSIVVYKKAIKNMVDNPAAGFTWNIEHWSWK